MYNIYIYIYLLCIICTQYTYTHDSYIYIYTYIYTMYYNIYIICTSDMDVQPLVNPFWYSPSISQDPPYGDFAGEATIAFWCWCLVCTP